MNAKQLAEWDDIQYQALKMSKRGNNFAYLTDKKYEHLTNNGYARYYFQDGKNTTHCRDIAIENVKSLRAKGNYASIICVSNKIRIKQYAIFYKPTNKLF